MGKELHRAVMLALPLHDHLSSPVKCRFYAAENDTESDAGDYRCSIRCTIGEDKYVESSVDQNFEIAWKACVDFISSKLMRRRGKHRKKGALPLQRLVRAWSV